MFSFLKKLWPASFGKDTFTVDEQGKPLRISAGGVVLGPDGRIIIVHQRGNSWSLPKGGVEKGESLRQGAEREIYEETGIRDLVYVDDLGTYDRYSIGSTGVGEDYNLPKGRRTFFFYKTAQTLLAPTDDEVTEARWVAVNEAITLLTHPRDQEFLRSVQGKIR